MKPLSRLILLLCACLATMGHRPGYGADPSLRWYTVTTPHFYVHYYRNARHDLSQVAQRVARLAEAAHTVLVSRLHHRPNDRTHVVVTDQTDNANGSAQIVPYNIIRVFVTGPEALSPLNDYDDWLYQLLIHEYTHILHIDTIHGLPRLVNAVFGKRWAPNQLQPRWFIEGLATFHETRRTSAGRLRSGIFEMMLRTDVLSSRMLRIDEIGSNTWQYPRGNIPYLYGGKFIQYIADRFGEEKLSRISHLYAAHPIPYGINRVAHRVLGHTLTELYADFGRHLRRRYTQQAGAVARRGKTHFRFLTSHGEFTRSPRYSPDGRYIAAIENDARSREALVLRDPESGAPAYRHLSFSGQGISFLPSGKALIADEIWPWRTFYAYGDLFLRQVEGGDRQRLTRGLRARHPAVSPDGRSVAFVTNDLGANKLKLISLQTRQVSTLLATKLGEQIDHPRWSPDGRLLTYSRWRQGGYRDIYTIDPRSKRETQITTDRAIDLTPTFGHAGRRIFFASDRTGIFNIYAYDQQSGELTQVTNLIGGAFSPAISPDGNKMAFVVFTERGYDLARMPLDPARFLPARPYTDRRPPPVSPPVPEQTFPVRRYQPWRTLYPRSWRATLGTDSFGSTLGLRFDGSDAIRRHQYAAAVDFSAGRVSPPSYALSYSYDRLWPVLGISTSRFEGRRGGLIIDGRRRAYVEESYRLSVRAGLPVWRTPIRRVDLGLGYAINWFGPADSYKVLVEPGMLSPRLPTEERLVGITLDATYRDAARFPYSISAEDGRIVGVRLRVNSETLASDRTSAQISTSWHEYLSLPAPTNHVLALRLAGGISLGAPGQRGLFSLGGFPEQNVIQAIVDTAPLGGNYLRGYPPGRFLGDRFVMLNAEYRLPLLDIQRGISSLPLYLNYLHGALFSDIGSAFFESPSLDQVNIGVGAELLLEWFFLYVYPFTLRVGYARGLTEEGGNEFHLLLGNRF